MIFKMHYLSRHKSVLLTHSEVAYVCRHTMLSLLRLLLPLRQPIPIGQFPGSLVYLLAQFWACLPFRHSVQFPKRYFSSNLKVKEKLFTNLPHLPKEQGIKFFSNLEIYQYVQFSLRTCWTVLFCLLLEVFQSSANCKNEFYTLKRFF